VWTIIERELLDNFKSFRWVALFVLCIILFSANGFVFARKYHIQQTDYITRITEPPFAPRSLSASNAFAYASRDYFNTNGGPNYPRPSTKATELYVPPSPLLFVAEGGDEYRPYGFDVRPGGVILPLPEKPKNYKLPESQKIDWTFIITTIFSLYVILFGYNTISEEKKQGTLSLVLSHAITRSKVLIAKYCVLIITLFIPLFAGFLISIMIMMLHVPSFLTIAVSVRLIIIILATMLFISFFSFLTLFITSKFQESSHGLLILLFAWILFLVIPRLASVTTGLFVDVPSEQMYSQQLKSKQNEYQKMADNTINDEKSPTFRGYFDSEENAQKAAYSIIKPALKEFLAIREQYNNAISHKTSIEHTISLVSPLCLFRDILEIFSGTGFENENVFYEKVRTFSIEYDNYIQEKFGDITVRFLPMGPSVHPWIRNEREHNKYQYTIQFPTQQEYEGDKSDFPRFVYNEPSLIARINDSFIGIIGLLVWNVVLAMGAFLAFDRADVR
jgi:ABC-type transport system involved in multi-copper enzyme maturation permease subunit